MLVAGGERRREGQVSDGGRGRGLLTTGLLCHRVQQARGVPHHLSNGSFNQLCSSVKDRFNIKAHFQSH